MSEFLQLHFRKSLLGAEQNYYVQLYLEDTGKPGDLRISEVKTFCNRPLPMVWDCSLCGSQERTTPWSSAQALFNWLYFSQLEHLPHLHELF